MGEVLYADFKTKARQYTKGGGFDDLTMLANLIFAEAFPASPDLRYGPADDLAIIRGAGLDPDLSA